VGTKLAWLIRKQSKFPLGTMIQHCHCSPLLHLYQLTIVLSKKRMQSKEEGQSKVTFESEETYCTTHSYPVKDSKTATRFLPLLKGCDSRTTHLCLWSASEQCGQLHNVSCPSWKVTSGTKFAIWPKMTHISPNFKIYLASLSASRVLFCFDTGEKLD
jgi:hypothetical protein